MALADGAIRFSGSGTPSGGDDMAWLDALAADVLPDGLIGRKAAGEVPALPSFLAAIRAAEARAGLTFGRFPVGAQNALVERRLRQLVEVCRTNSLWRARIDAAIGTAPLESFEAFQAIPATDKETAGRFFTGDRPGMVVPIATGGFQVATSGGTASGRPTEIVYPLDELSDTYRWAGQFIGRHLVNRHMPADAARWVACTLADHMMWSSSSMVGGVLQAIPGVNYIAAGAIDHRVFGRMLAYPGSKAIMGISRSIADLVYFAQHIPAEDRATLRVALYGSGALRPKVHADLKSLYPNLAILSFFAAMQAETIGLQLDPGSPVLTAIPGLHLVEIVDAEGRGVGIDEEGDLLVTRLFGNGAPVLRYRLGDRAIRRPDLVSDSLNALRFEYVGRADDRFEIAGLNVYAPTVIASVIEALRDDGLVDLEAIADDIQIRLDRGGRRLAIVATTSEADVLSRRIDAQRSEVAIAAGVAGGAAASTTTEANAARLRDGGYRFELVLVPPGSSALHITEVGKTPVLVVRA
jgi:phenylacetate-CoA ligase